MDIFKNKIDRKGESEDLERYTKEVNDLIPLLAWGVTEKMKEAGMIGKIDVYAFASEKWGVSQSPDNKTDIQNVILYPKDALVGDRNLFNALLRHEIGNLNYPIKKELEELKQWCRERNIVPELLVSLVSVVNEASVNYLEMRNSLSDKPQENFKILYEREIDTREIASSIKRKSLYRQSLDLVLLCLLSETDLIPRDRFDNALSLSHERVRACFDEDMVSLLVDVSTIAVPTKKIAMIRDFLWPRLFHLIGDEDNKNQTTKEKENNQDKKEKTKDEKGSEEKNTEEKKGDSNSEEQNKEGGAGNSASTPLKPPSDSLLKEIKEMELKISNKAEEVKLPRDIEKQIASILKKIEKNKSESEEDKNSREEYEKLNKLKESYGEELGISGDTLYFYMKYMEETRDLVEDLVEFFENKLNPDSGYTYERNQSRGRLQSGFHRRIMGMKDSVIYFNPKSFEKKNIPEKPDIVWSIIIDNSESTEKGDIITEEKKLAVALVEVAKRIHIPIEILTFGGIDDFIFLKKFDEDLHGEDLQRFVCLEAHGGTYDTEALQAACASTREFISTLDNPCAFVYCLTDGETNSVSKLHEILDEYREDMVVLGIGLADGAAEIVHWGDNGLAVQNVEDLSVEFIKKLESQVESIFN